MECEGYDKRNCSIKRIGNIELKPYFKTLLNMTVVRGIEKEGVVLLAIKDNQVKDSLLFCGESESIISSNDYEKYGALKFVEKNSKDCKIYHYHNHPYRLAAIPSIFDLYNPNYKNKPQYGELPKGMERIDLFSDYEFEDVGIVTRVDFCSFRQVGKQYLLTKFNKYKKEEEGKNAEIERLNNEAKADPNKMTIERALSILNQEN